MKYTLFKCLIQGVGKNKLPILIYHRVHSDKDPISPNEVDATEFTWQMELVSKVFNVLPLSEAVELLSNNSLPPGSLSITFDDGYSDNATVALPILQRFGLKATFFIATGFLDGGRMWNDTVIETIRCMPNGMLDLTGIGFEIYILDTWHDRQRCAESIISAIKHLPSLERSNLTEQLAAYAPKALPGNLMLTTAQVKALSDAGMEIGGHTVTHPILECVALEEAGAEIYEGKKRLEEIVGKTVELFAYPNGKPNHDYSSDHVRLVCTCGFKAAVSTEWGVSDRNTDRFQLRRFTPWDRTPLRFLTRLVRNYYNIH